MRPHGQHHPGARRDVRKHPMTVMRFKMSPDEADRILDSLPMPREWWRQVAARFRELYHMTPDELRALSDPPPPRELADVDIEAFVCVQCSEELPTLFAASSHCLVTGHREVSVRARINKVHMTIRAPQEG